MPTPPVQNLPDLMRAKLDYELRTGSDACAVVLPAVNRFARTQPAVRPWPLRQLRPRPATVPGPVLRQPRPLRPLHLQNPHAMTRNPVLLLLAAVLAGAALILLSLVFF